MKATNLTQVITLRVSRKLYKKLLKYSQTHGLPISLVVRRWLTDKLKYSHVWLPFSICSKEAYFLQISFR